MTPIKTGYFPLNIFVEYINFNRLKIESSRRERLGEATRAESNEWWDVGPSSTWVGVFAGWSIAVKIMSSTKWGATVVTTGFMDLL